MSFVRTWPDGAMVEVLRCKFKSPMVSEKVWMPGTIVKLMTPPSDQSISHGPIILESYLVSFMDGSVGEFDTQHTRHPQPKKQAGRSIFPRKAKGFMPSTAGRLLVMRRLGNSACASGAPMFYVRIMQPMTCGAPGPDYHREVKMEKLMAFGACLAISYLIVFHWWAPELKMEHQHVRYFAHGRHIIAKWKLGGPVSVMWE